MSGGNEKSPGGKRRFIRRADVIGDLVKASLLMAVIALAGYGVMVRAEKLKRAEVLTNITLSGIDNSEEMTRLKRMMDKGELQEAIGRLKAIIRAEPGNFVAHYFLGIAYARKGLSSEAIAEFEKVLELGGWPAETNYNMGVIYESLGFYDKAFTAYEAARCADPGNKSYIRARDKVDYVVEADLGFEQQYQIRFNEASAALARVPPDLLFASNSFEYLAEKFPNKVEPLHMLGVTRTRQGRVEEAEEIFLSAVELEPGFAISHYNLGILYQAQGRWAEAHDAFMRCLHLTTDEKNRKVVSAHLRQVREHLQGADPKG